LYHSHSAEEILENIGIYFDTLNKGRTYGSNEVEKDAETIDSCEAAAV
ncbi:MAG: hypothetical protein HKN25_08575, partial [Pyrinomonadaceae bacterium]|nr:hypothetical protein [Pyrinomonadaceae bacterium]